MYTSFFGIHEKPFSITPDPRYLFMSARHGEALAHLVYGVTESGGFVQLTGEVGTGKTTLCRTLLLNRMPANADVAVILNPQLSAMEFLEAICEEVGMAIPEPRGSVKALIDALNRFLLDAHAEGRRTILIVDEAQNLARDVLEQVRLLTNLETAKQKLLQIILIGQPELRDLLARNDLRQLAQRITGRYHLEPLSCEETDQYIEHRLKVAGALGEIFDVGAKREVFRLSQGVPRLINVICDRALLGAYSLGSRRVGRRLVRRAAAEVKGESNRNSQSRWPAALVGIAATIVIAAVVSLALQNRARTNAALPPEPVAPVAVEVAKAVPAVEVVAAEPYVSLEDQLALAEELTTANTALATLFDLWGLDYDPAVPGGCAQLDSAGYRCLIQRGSWSRIRQLNRPAILTLTDGGGDTHFVVLTSMDGNQLGLSIGGVAVSHPIDVVAEMWFGQYQMLWQPPNGQLVSLGPGSNGSNVIWLRQSLAAIDPRYRAEPLDSEAYDGVLAQRVRDFQRDHRIEVDGVAGYHTQIILNTLLASGSTPQLTTPQLARN
jgi:general secretion pathway protein A